MQYSLFYNCSYHLLPFRRSGPVNMAEEEEHKRNQQITNTKVFVEQPMASPGTSNYQTPGVARAIPQSDLLLKNLLNAAAPIH